MQLIISAQDQVLARYGNALAALGIGQARTALSRALNHEGDKAGKKRLAGDTAREATSDEVKDLRAEARQLKETLAEVLLENRLLKKSVLGDGESDS